MLFRKPEQDPYQQSFLLCSSSLKEHNSTSTTEKDSFITCAKFYKLQGLPVHELCDHNYKVALDLGRQDVAQSWLILKLLYCGSEADCSRIGLIQTKLPSRHTAGSGLSTVQPAYPVDSGSEVHTAHGKESSTTQDSKLPGLKETAPSSDSPPDENEDEVEESNPLVDAATYDFFDERDERDSDLAATHSIVQQQQPQQEWGELPAEPIQLRQDIHLLRPASPDHEGSSAVSTAHSAIESSSSAKPT